MFDIGIAGGAGPDRDLPPEPDLLFEPWNRPTSAVRPNGYAALELQDATLHPNDLTDAEIVEAIRAYDHVVSWAGARQAAMLAEFARRRPPDRTDVLDRATPGPVSTWAPDEIGLALTLSRGTAADRIERSLRLEQVLPAALAAWETGQLDVAKVNAIHDATLWLSDTAAGAVQDRVLPKAPSQTVAQLRAALERAVIAVDPDGADARHRKAYRSRRVAINPDRDGMASLWALLSAPDALNCYGWLTALARGLPTCDPRSMDARRADLLVQLLTGNLRLCPDSTDPAAAGPPPADPTPADPTAAADGDPTADAADAADVTDTDAAATKVAAAQALTTAAHSSAGAATSTADGDGAATDSASGSRSSCEEAVPLGGLPTPVAAAKPLVHVVIPLSILTGADDSPVELTGYGPLPAALGREIAADAVWKRLITDPLTGAVLDVGRTSYRPPTALAEFLRARDQHCRVPICRRSARDSQIDHTVAFHSQGGSTDRDNLYHACLCHHRMKDAPGWTVTQEPDGVITWTTPTGHRYSSRPHDYRPEPDLAAVVAALDRAAATKGDPFDRPIPPEADDPPPF